MSQNNQNLPLIEVFSSRLLNDKQKAEIEKHALKVFKVEKADFEYKKDDSLIGGFIVKLESKVVDLSVNQRFNCL